MSTLAVMKARIAQELGDRTDLTSEIASAITDAVTEYAPKRFYFNESRSVTFSTVAAQEFYTSADNANIPNLYRIDLVSVDVGGQVQQIDRASNKVLELWSDGATQTGDPPREYAYFARQIRLYPVPTAVRTVRITGHIKFAAPASDSEADNVWMTEAEKLIRSRAKYELAIHKLHDQELAMLMTAAVTEQLSTLGIQTGRRVGRGRIRATQF